MFTEIAFTAYAVTDIKKAREFYEGILGLTPNGEFDKDPDSKWIEYNIGNSTLGIGQSDMWKPSQDGASVALETENFDDTYQVLKDKGVKIAMGPNDFPSCNMVVILDPDNNKITIHKRKK